MSAPAITVSYTLNPPANVAQSTSLEHSKTHTFPINVASDRKVSSEAYYAALNSTIQEAKTTLGREFTVWRDAVGTTESDKERKVQKAKADDDGDDGEDEADE